MVVFMQMNTHITGLQMIMMQLKISMFILCGKLMITLLHTAKTHQVQQLLLLLEQLQTLVQHMMQQ